MARVAGIISAGLASAREFRAEPETRASLVQDAARVRAGRQARTQTAGLPPDWLTSAAAGAGAGWLFGPAGALIGGGIAALLSKKRREGILAYVQQSSEATEGALDRGRKAIASALDQAETDQQRAEIKMLADEFETYASASSHPDPSVSAQALVKALEVSGQMDAELEEFQADRQRVEDMEIARRKEQFDTFDNLRGDLVRESARFIAAREAWQGAQALAKNPSPSNDISLIYKMANINDPGAIVTEGDVQVIQSSGSITEQMAQLYNSVLRGEAALSDTQRQGLVATIDTLYRQQRNEQIERNAEFQNIGTASRLEPGYQQLLRIPIDPSEANALARTANWRPPSDGSVPVPEEMRTEIGELTPEQPGLTAKFVDTMLTGAGAIAEDVLRMQQGIEIVTSQDGRKFERHPDGKLVEIPPSDLFEDENGGVYRRVDRGEGRYEWTPVKPAPITRRFETEPPRRGLPGRIYPINRPVNE